jgi:hypothetical protein
MGKKWYCYMEEKTRTISVGEPIQHSGTNKGNMEGMVRGRGGYRQKGVKKVGLREGTENTKYNVSKIS